MQAIQEVFTAEEWVKDAQNEARVETNLRANTNKAMGAVEQKNRELMAKLTTEERKRKSAEAGLKDAQNQAEKQRKRLHYAEIELATARQQVLELKVDLEKAKEAARTAKEVAEALERAFYDHRVQETKVRLAEELAEVYSDYCQEVWVEALNLAGVPATSE